VTSDFSGSSALDTGIYYGTPSIPTNLIAVVQDSTNVNFARDFIFV
jgi:hypothetical protein